MRFLDYVRRLSLATKLLLCLWLLFLLLVAFGIHGSYGQYMQVYNNLAHIFLTYDGEESPVRFVPIELTQPGVATLAVQISPNNPILKEMGARYVVAFDKWQQALGPARLNLIYRSSTGRFSIFEIPQ